MKRLFAAIKVHPDKNLSGLYDDLRSLLRNEKIRWVDEKNLHITLKFFGETPESQIDLICETLDEVAYNHQPLHLKLQNIGIFGSKYNPRVIWFGMEKNPAIESLARDVIQSLDKAGFPHDGQKFRAHLTVGRIKFINDKRNFQQSINLFKDVFIQSIQVGEFVLYESILRPRGPEYTVVEGFKLGG
ncbi:MAG: 2'-5' RNA ligase [Bacteroidetes bacterium 4484_276]|nr:MAG: 2'-5' RNA ligase [Bacteroidetes bacterium 4484_276]